MNEQEKRDFRATLLKDYGIDLAADNELLPILLMQYDLQKKTTVTIEEQKRQFSDIIQKLNSSITKLDGFQKQNVFYGDAAKHYRPWLWPVVAICVTALILTFWFGWFRNEVVNNLKSKIIQQELTIQELTKGKK